jgi:Tol biopolymer transport system component
LRVALSQAGELIAREELAAALWPEGVHVDFEGNLNTIIRDARQALGDSARKPRFIETQFKRGYRFVAPARVITHGAEPVSVKSDRETARPPLPAPRALRLAWMLVVAVAVALAGGFALYRYWRVNWRGSEAVKIRQLTSYLGAASHPSFSPDGKRVVFEWNGDERGRYGIWIREIGSDKLKRLTNGVADEHAPAWSPDGRDIAFLRDASRRDAALIIVPAPGGAERQVAILPRDSAFVWSPDGRWIAYSVSMPDYVRSMAAQLGIQAISLETGQTVRITTPGPSFLGDAFPAFSPDGKRLAFFRLTSLAEDALYSVGINPNMQPADVPRRLTPAQIDGRDPVWLPGNKAIVFSAGTDAFNALWRTSAQESSKPQLLGGEDAYQPAVDPAHGRLSYTRMSLVDSLNTLVLCGRGCTPAPAKRLLYSEKRATNPVYSPDGEFIAFESFRTGHMEIWVCTKDGLAPRQLSHSGGPLTGTPRWSPDSKHIAFDSRVNGKGKIFTLSLSDGATVQLTSGAGDDIVPSWSRDGRRVYFASNRSGAFQVWKVPAEGGEPVQVTKSGGFYAVESVDGTSLYYAKDTAQTAVWKVPVDGGIEKEVIPLVSAWCNFYVSRDGMFFVPSGGASESIQFFDFATGAIRLVAAVGSAAVQGFSIAPDGRTVVLSKRDSATSDLMLLEGGSLSPPAGRE